MRQRTVAQGAKWLQQRTTWKQYRQPALSNTSRGSANVLSTRFSHFGCVSYEEENDENDYKQIHKLKSSFSSRSPRLYVSPAGSLLSSSLFIDHNKSNNLACVNQYHTSTRRESTTIVLGLGAMALTAKAGQYGVQAYQEYKNSLPEEPETSADSSSSTQNESQAKAQDSSSGKAKAKTDGKRVNIFQEWFGLGVGSKYYEGGFEEKMTRREAALILGVRESSTAKRIKEAHRKILILNHPDTGGSTYIASKINEAKELLLKGKENY